MRMLRTLAKASTHMKYYDCELPRLGLHARGGAATPWAAGGAMGKKRDDRGRRMTRDLDAEPDEKRHEKRP